jgi:hypothetical protein
VTAARQQLLPLRPAGAPAPRPLTPVLSRPLRVRPVVPVTLQLSTEPNHGR